MKREEYKSYIDPFFEELSKSLSELGYDVSTKKTSKSVRYLYCSHEDRFVKRYVRVGVPYYWSTYIREISVEFEVCLKREAEDDFYYQMEGLILDDAPYEIRTFFIGSGQKYYHRLYAKIQTDIRQSISWMDNFDSLKKMLIYLEGDFTGQRGHSWQYLTATGDLGRFHRSEERRAKFISTVKDFIANSQEDKTEQ